MFFSFEFITYQPLHRCQNSCGNNHKAEKQQDIGAIFIA